MTKKAFFLSRLIDLTGHAVCIDGSHQDERGECSRYEFPPPEQVPHGQGDEQEDEEALEPFQGGVPEVVGDIFVHNPVSPHVDKASSIRCLVMEFLV